MSSGHEASRELLQTVPVALLVQQDEIIVFANAAACSLLGYDDCGSVVGARYHEIVHGDDLALVAERIQRVRRGLSNPPAEMRWRGKGGRMVWVEVSSCPRNFDGRDAAIVTGFDVTRRRDAEQRLVSSLRDRELLLREIHHRIKNDLQTVASMLFLQADMVSDDVARESLLESQTRVNAVALLHEQLYRSPDLSRLSMRSYMQSLMADVARALRGVAIGVEMSMVCDDVLFDPDTAIACGVVACELVTNALKHAFIGRTKGRIAASLRCEDSEAVLRVVDDGVGMPSDLDPRSGATIGYELICEFAEKLHAQLTIERTGGTAVELRFPVTP